MRKKHSPDFISIILIVVILSILVWLGISLFGNIRFSDEIRRENQTLAELKYDFDELKKINKDICGWITINNTNIDFPIVHTSNNITYLTKTAYGENAAYGAIFLDYRNNPDFSDVFSLVYGHHMSDGNMFGDIDKFTSEKFFTNNTGGTLTTPEHAFELECVAFMIIPSETKFIYDPTSWNDKSFDKYMNWIKENAEHINEDVMRKVIEEKDTSEVLALSTCTSYDEKLRYVLILNRDVHISE